MYVFGTVDIIPQLVGVYFTQLVGGWTNPSEKYYIVKFFDHFPKDRGEHTKIFETTT